MLIVKRLRHSTAPGIDKRLLTSLYFCDNVRNVSPGRWSLMCTVGELTLWFGARESSKETPTAGLHVTQSCSLAVQENPSAMMRQGLHSAIGKALPPFSLWSCCSWLQCSSHVEILNLELEDPTPGTILFSSFLSW